MNGKLRLAGVLLAVLGLVWVLQGVGVLPGSFMTGQSFWAWTGLVCLVVGVGLVIGGGLRRKPPR